MNWGSICSGIGAPEVAARSIPGIDFRWCAEIEAFPSVVLAARFGHINHGDFTQINRAGGPVCEPVEGLVGGTPCQSFSGAGQRGGLADSRGWLSIEYCELTYRIGCRWVVWENVPGVFSADGGQAFAAFLSCLTGRVVGVPEGGWRNAGIIPSEADCFGVAWRVLDAQYSGLAQRRKRVFVVGYLGDWRRAAAVLFERQSLSGHPAPRRTAGKIVAGTIGACAKGGGGKCVETVDALLSSGRGVARMGDPRGQDPVIAVNVTHTHTHEIAMCLNSHGGRFDSESETLVTHTLKGEGFDASEDGTGRGVPLIAFPARLSGTQYASSIDISPAVAALNPMAVAYDLRGRDGGSQFEGPHDMANMRAASGGSSRSYICAYAVRRLMPVECERLQGFSGAHTAIEYRGKAAADGPRYRAIGNSMAVPVMRWILERVKRVDALRISA